MLLECLEGATQTLEKPTIGHICDMKGRLENTLSDRQFFLNQNDEVIEPVEVRCL